jgi:hypothetical protein
MKQMTCYEDFYRRFSSQKGNFVLSSLDKLVLKRLVNKYPEVMVKVTGKTMNLHGLKNHLNYITREGQIEIDVGPSFFLGKEAMKDLLFEWKTDLILQKQRSCSINMMVSMPSQIDRQSFKDAVSDFVICNLRSNFDTMIVHHDDTPHPHAHLVVRNYGYNGERFKHYKSEMKIYRESFAKSLRKYGIEAEATPRFARSTLRSKKRGLWHLLEKGVVPRIEKEAVGKVWDELKKGIELEKPWEKAVLDRYYETKRVYFRAAFVLSKSSSLEDQELSVSLKEFSRTLPFPLFVQDFYREALKEKAIKKRTFNKELSC